MNDRQQSTKAQQAPNANLTWPVPDCPNPRGRTLLYPPSSKRADVTVPVALDPAREQSTADLTATRGVAPHSPSARVARGALSLLTTQPLTWMTSLLTTVLVPQYLGAQGLGQYAVVVTVAGLAGTITTL